MYDRAGQRLWYEMDSSIVMPSPQLVEANRRLYGLRAQKADVRRSASVAQCSSTQSKGRGSLPVDAARAPIAALPPHLGWGSETLTAVARAAQARKEIERDGFLWNLEPPQPLIADESKKTAVSNNSTVVSGAVVKVYPDIALGMLREEMAASGRIWLLARYLDKEGEGVLRVANLRETLTTKSSPFRVCGWRQLRNLLRQGEGVYWHRDKTRLWLHSAVKTAYSLGVTRLNGRPVAVPVKALTGGVGDVRAHLYASFHSGRVKENKRGKATTAGSMPISRDALTAVSGAGRVSQRNYEARTNVKVSHNFAIGETADNKENREDRIWQKGGAAFILKDYRGEQGRKGKSYLAWQLPNGYSGTHRQRPLGRQKRINRELKDLVMKGMPGNVGGAEDTLSLELAKRYYPNGKLAAKRNGRAAEDRFWPQQKAGDGRSRVWQTIKDA